MFSLFLRQFANVMAFAGNKNEKQSGQRRERKPKTKHARESNGRLRRGATKRLAARSAALSLRSAMRLARVLPFLLSLGLSSCHTVIPPYPADAPATEEGYKKVVEDRLGSIWYRLVNKQSDYLKVGTVELTCVIPPLGGRVRDIKVTSSTGGHLDKEIAVAAVEEVRAPPIPGALLQKLDHGCFELKESFTVFQERAPTPSPKNR